MLMAQTAFFKAIIKTKSSHFIANGFHFTIGSKLVGSLEHFFSFTRMSSCSVCMSFVRLGHHDG